MASAGRPPPLLLHPGGQRTDIVPVQLGAPIGTGQAVCETVELDLPAGATLVLYTNGLVESRHRGIGTGIERLQNHLHAYPPTGAGRPPLEELCDDVLHTVDPGDRDDNIALLVARFYATASSDT